MVAEQHMVRAEQLDQWVATNGPTFVAIEGLAAEIQEQNNAYATLVGTPTYPGQLTIPELRETAAELLRTAQQETFEALVQAGEDAPYTELWKQDEILTEALGAYATRMASLVEQPPQKVVDIQQDTSLLASTSALAKKYGDKIAEVAARLEEEARREALQHLHDEQQALAAARAHLDEVLEVAGQPWPLPQLLTAEQRKAALASEQRSITDEYPLPEMERVRQRVAVGARRVFDSRKPDASEVIGLVFITEPHVGKSFTLGELAEIVYGEDTRETRDRISAHLSNLRSGDNAKLESMLAKQGLVLQRGLRRYHDELDGRKRYVIYRAVPQGQEAMDRLDNRQQITANEAYVELVDEWFREEFHRKRYDER